MSDNSLSEGTARQLVEEIGRLREALSSPPAPPVAPNALRQAPSAAAASIPSSTSSRPSLSLSGVYSSGTSTTSTSRRPTVIQSQSGSTRSTLPSSIYGQNINRWTTGATLGTCNSAAAARQAIIGQEHQSLFRPFSTGVGRTSRRPTGSSTRKKAKTKTFTRLLILLSDTNEVDMPSPTRKAELAANGLGEKTAVFNEGGDANYVADVILSTYGKVELEWGFEILTPITRLLLGVVHLGACSCERLQLLSTRKLYIRPIQANIPLTAMVPCHAQLVPCNRCMGRIPIQMMRSHLEDCGTDPVSQDQYISLSSDSGGDGELPDPQIHGGDVAGAASQDPQIHGGDVAGAASQDPQIHGGDVAGAASQNSADDDIVKLLEIVKEGFDSSSDVADIIKAFRDVFIIGRSLNLQASGGMFAEGNTNEIIASRRNIFRSTIDELGLSTFNARLPLKVAFMGEQGADLGGPRREFLQLALHEIHENVFFGPKKNRELIIKQEFVKENTYLVVGRLLGLCILQDGPPPHFLSSSLVDLIFGEDVPRNESQQQLAKGLKETGIIDLVKQFPQTRQLLLEAPAQRLTATGLVNLFKAHFSEAGSNQRLKEEEACSHFVKYLGEVEAGTHHKDSNTEGRVLMLSDIVRFTTGLDEAPAAGWCPPLSITFQRQDIGLFGLSSSTCSHELRIPIPENSLDALPSREVMMAIFNGSFGDDFFWVA